MEYLLTEAGNIKIGPNGKPLVKGDDGKEFEIDAIGAQQKINDVTTESNDRRKKLGEANTKLETYGDLDPVAASEAMQTVASMGDKQKVELDTLKNTLNEAWKVKETAWGVEKGELNGKLYEATTGSQFATSKVVAGLIYPPGAAATLYGKHFPIGKPPQFEDNKPIYSLERPGEAASFDEAMTQIIAADPNKDSILKTTAGDGGDGHKTTDGGGGGAELSSFENIRAGLAKL